LAGQQWRPAPYPPVHEHAPYLPSPGIGVQPPHDWGARKGINL